MKHLAIVFTLLFAWCARGGEYHVSAVAGQDGDGSKGNPFKTIQEAADRMKHGDACIVSPGLYRETVTPKTSGTEDRPIIFRASEQGATTIVDHNVVWNVGNGIRLNLPTGFCMVLNNSVFKDMTHWGLWRGQMVQWGCHVMNNLTTNGIEMKPEVVNRANIHDTLVNVFDFKTRTLAGHGPGTGKGLPIPDITPKGNVDVGAWQSGAPEWRAGYDWKNPPTVAYTPAREFLRNYVQNAAFEYPRYYKEADQSVDPLIHWTKTGTATVEFHEGFNTPPASERNSVHGNSL